MPVILNSAILPNLPDEMFSAQRAMFYADGLFETFRVFNGKTPFLDRHLNRLFSGMEAMGYELPADWTLDFFAAWIHKIAPTNARIRLAVWRSTGGFYFPENNTPQFLITAEPLETAHFQWLEQGVSLGVSESVRLPIDAFSGFKTLNGARYVAAAREAWNRGWDDALLLNASGRVAEATASNVFWCQEGRILTPPLGEGEVAGTLRSVLLEISVKAGMEIQEKPVAPEEISEAEEIFLSNAIRGIVPVRIFAGRTLAHSRTKQLFEELQQEVNRLIFY